MYVILIMLQKAFGKLLRLSKASQEKCMIFGEQHMLFGEQYKWTWEEGLVQPAHCFTKDQARYYLLAMERKQ